jgi:hypothetical protein
MGNLLIIFIISYYIKIRFDFDTFVQAPISNDSELEPTTFTSGDIAKIILM